MTDNEIIMRLEWAIADYEANVPADIKERLYRMTDCGTMRKALDLINHQKAEIERLKAENRILSQKRINFFERIEIVTAAEVRAVKEFAETLKVNYSDFIGDCYYEDSFRAYIDNYVKEKVGDNNA